VRRDCFCFTCALEDEELREDGNGFEKNGEGPEYFSDVVGVVEEESEDECGAEEVLDTERVDGRVVCWPEACVNATVLSHSQAEKQNDDVPEAYFH